SINGLIVYRGSVAGLARNSTSEPACSRRSNASASPWGDSQIAAAARSAANSRLGESRRCTNAAAIGASTKRRTRWNQPPSRLISISTPAELEGVIAHELVHVRNRDVLVQTTAVVLAGVLIEMSRL